MFQFHILQFRRAHGCGNDSVRGGDDVYNVRHGVCVHVHLRDNRNRDVRGYTLHSHSCRRVHFLVYLGNSCLLGVL